MAFADKEEGIVELNQVADLLKAYNRDIGEEEQLR